MGDGLVAANVPDARALAAEVKRLQDVIVSLRSPAGAVRMAVQMLSGPFRHLLARLDTRDRLTMEGVLESLEVSTRQLCDVASTSLTTPFQTAGPRVNAQPLVPRVPEPKPTAKKSPPKIAPKPPPAPTKKGPLDVAEILERLEVMTVTRSPLPALLAVDAPRGLQLNVASAELLQALGYLVDNALEASARSIPGPGPWTVAVRAYADPTEILGDELDIVIEVRDGGVGVPRDVSSWLTGPIAAAGPASSKADRQHGRGLRVARALAEQAGGSLEVVRAGHETVVRLRLPQAG